MGNINNMKIIIKELKQKNCLWIRGKWLNLCYDIKIITDSGDILFRTSTLNKAFEWIKKEI